MKVKKMNSKNFLTRGKIHELGNKHIIIIIKYNSSSNNIFLLYICIGCFIRDNDINALFINSELSTL